MKNLIKILLRKFTGLFSEVGPLTSNERKKHIHQVHQELPERKVAKQEKLHFIYFIEEDEYGVIYPHNDPLVIRAQVNDRMMEGILVDSGAGANVISAEVGKKLEIRDSKIKPYSVVLGGLVGGISAKSSGSVDFIITLGQGDERQTEKLTAFIMPGLSGYNMYLGRPGINAFRAICSIHHLKMKYLTRSGKLVIVRGSQKMARVCEVCIMESLAEEGVVKTVRSDKEFNGKLPLLPGSGGKTESYEAPNDLPSEVHLKSDPSNSLKLEMCLTAENKPI